MSRRRLLLIGGATLVALLVGAGGYVLGATGAPGSKQAAEAREAAASAAFYEAKRSAMRQGVDKGRSAGVADGRRAGARKGAAQGIDAGRADVRFTVRSLQASATQRSESKADIGGIADLGDEPGGSDNGSPNAPLEGSGGVLVVGDSLEVLTIPYLKQYLPGVKLTTNAVGGYNSFQIFDLFQESYDPSQSVIVFDSGTNDNPNYPQILAGRLQAVAGEIGNRCMVVPSIHGLTVGGVGNAGKNRTVSSFVASRPGTQSPDWEGAVAAHPELMQSDNLHPIAAGADLRARLIAEGVKRCLQFD